MATAQATKNQITLKGSVATVSEFFSHALSSILYQRGIYAPESFEPRKAYGLTVMAVKDDKLAAYLQAVLQQFSKWLEGGALQKVVLVVTGASSKEVLERWTFDIQTDKGVVAGSAPLPEKSEAQITQEIQAIIRQITASVTFLPLLQDTCTIDLLAYTDKENEVPLDWEESDPRYITNAADVKLRAFSTKVHNVEALVQFKTEDD
ncbi:dna-binding horma domain-containing [Micractinium conductrix]|uniref:Dna-binding horma domain-containing n=1 Tax=Micractinium conductrix TaxID=554055 RepID=A0A2P6VGX3_9CHLO|nr:dna-binding horma domain-containing [Micractinium conductrix]|eukprot:PSC73333.1 dna-binding horma domain-containing [Micractinium conductrix]